MLRSLLVGVLALSAASACKDKTDAPVVQPGAAVGNVVEVTGDVSATRGTAKRALAAGEEISGDDTIETAAGANVRIVLAHNNATWELGPNKKQVVSESLAWKLAKQDSPAAKVDEATLAAGRHAERETVTTGNTAPPPADTASAAATAEAPARSAPGGSPRGGQGGGGDPAPREANRRAASGAPPTVRPSDDGTDKEATAKGAPAEASRKTEASPVAPPKPLAQPMTTKAPTAPSADMPPPPPPPPPAEMSKTDATDDVRRSVTSHRAELLACMDGASLSLTVIVAKGKATFTFPAGTSATVKTCLSAIATKLSFPADYTVKTTLPLTK